MSLLTSLQAAYTFENGGNLGLDSTANANNLTNNNAATQVAGNAYPGTKAVNFSQASSQSLSIPSNATLQVGGTSWELSAWVNFTSYPGSGFPGIVGKWGGTGGLEYLLYYSATTTKIQAAASYDGVSSVMLTTARPSLGVWVFLDMWFDLPNATFNFNFNNAAATDGGSVGCAAVNSGGNAFVIGSTAFGAPWLDGVVDSVNLWKRLLTPAERTSLYRAGAGLEFPAFAGTGRRRSLTTFI